MPRSIYHMTQDQPPSTFTLPIDALSPDSPFLTSPIGTKGFYPSELPDKYYVDEGRLHCVAQATPRPCGTRPASFRFRDFQDVVVVLLAIRENCELFRGRLLGPLVPIRSYLTRHRDAYKECDDLLVQSCDANSTAEQKEVRVLNFWLSVDMFCRQPNRDHATGLLWCLESLLDSEDVWDELEELLIQKS